jgi:hypothetical protein
MFNSRKPQTPGGGGGIPNWSYAPVKAGSQYRGWKAGPVCGVFIHQLTKRSEPCIGMMTELALACPHCADKHKWEWKGYVPFYDEEYTRRFCLISPAYYEAVEEIDHLAPIVINRGKKDTDPVVVKYNAWRSTPIPFSVERAKGVDLMNFIVRVLWCSRELMEYAAKQEVQTIGDPASAGNPVADKIAKGEHATIGDWTSVALGKKANRVNNDRNAAFAEAVRNEKPSKNGHSSG